MLFHTHAAEALTAAVAPFTVCVNFSLHDVLGALGGQGYQILCQCTKARVCRYKGYGS